VEISLCSKNWKNMMARILNKDDATTNICQNCFYYTLKNFEIYISSEHVPICVITKGFCNREERKMI
jgi:hypothetical protein